MSDRIVDTTAGVIVAVLGGIFDKELDISEENQDDLQNVRVIDPVSHHLCDILQPRHS